MSCILDIFRRIPARLRANDPEPESYETKVRVLSITCMCILTSASIIGGIWLVFTRPSPLPAGYYILQAGMMCWAVTSWIVLGWGLYMGKTIPKMMDAILGGCILASFLAVLGAPYFDARYAAMNLFTAVALVVGATWWRLWVTLCIILGFMNCYDRVAFHAGWHPAAIDPFGKEDMSTLTYAISTAGYFLGCLIHCATLLLQHAEHVRAKAAAVAAGEVTATIAVKLQAYDTTAAAEALKHEAAAGVDKELKSAFTALVANLESYRPYLPNWLLAGPDEEMDGVADSESSLDHSFTKLSLASCGTPTRPSSAPPQQSQPLTAAAVMHQEPTSTPPAEQTASQPPMSCRSSDGGEEKVPGSDRSSEPSSSGHNAYRPNDMAAIAAAIAAGPTRQKERTYWKGTVTFAVIEYSTEDVPDSSLSETLTAVADAVHRCAADCKGAVHTMLLGEIVVSWNAATRVAGPEAKAARFLLALKAMLTEDDSVHHRFKAVAGAATHNARSESIGTSKKVLTSERTGSLRFKLRGICRYAWTARAIAERNGDVPAALAVVLLDDPTTRGASSNFIISSGAVLDLAGHLPSADMPYAPLAGHVPEPAPTAASPPISPSTSELTTINGSFAHSTFRGRGGSGSTSRLSSAQAGAAAAAAATRIHEALPGQPGHPSTPPRRPATSGSDKDTHKEQTDRQLVTLVDKSCAGDHDSSGRRTPGIARGVVHVFDLVSPRAGGDDEWLYAMEEGAADAARTAQLLIGAGRQQSGGVDAIIVREAFEKAGKQRDGQPIMARPLVRQLIEDLHLLPVRV